MTALPKYNLAAASDLLHVSVDTLRRRCRAGLYPHMRPGREVMFSDADIAAICELMHAAPKTTEPAELVPVSRRRR